MAFHNAVWLISMVKIQELFPSYTGTTKTTTWQTEWAVMAVNYVQSHWSCWIVLSPNLRAVCKRLQRTLLGQLAMCRSAAEPRLCEFWTRGSFNSASTWLIGIRKEVFLHLLSEMKSIYLTSAYKCPSHPWVLATSSGVLFFLSESIPPQLPAEATHWEKSFDKACWLESRLALWLSSHSRHALAPWRALRIKLLASLAPSFHHEDNETMSNTRTVQPNDGLQWASVFAQTCAWSLLCVDCFHYVKRVKNNVQEWAGVTNWDTAFRKAQSATYHGAAQVIHIMVKTKSCLDLT